MIHEIIKIGERKATLEVYAADKLGERALPPRRAMIILPGGGYGPLSDIESEPVAKAFFSLGFNVFLLRYSVCEDAVFPRPVRELSETVVFIKRNAEKYDINPERIFVCGFSGGGHLAAYYASAWAEEDGRIEQSVPGENKPCGVLLAYPGIAMAGEHFSKSDAGYIIGHKIEDGDCKEAEKYSADLHVSEKTVPVFLWHTLDDSVIHPSNAMRYINALLRFNVPYEYHCFGHGYHGISLANEETWGGDEGNFDRCIALWPRLALGWIEKGEKHGDFDRQ